MARGFNNLFSPGISARISAILSGSVEFKPPPPEKRRNGWQSIFCRGIIILQRACLAGIFIDLAFCIMVLNAKRVC